MPCGGGSGRCWATDVARQGKRVQRWKEKKNGAKLYVGEVWYMNRSKG